MAYPRDEYAVYLSWEYELFVGASSRNEDLQKLTLMVK